jgi:hypothetical protein
MKQQGESATVLLGYEIPTGEPVSIPIRHTVITGRTQESGKTTALSALISRSKRKALAFITKRSEKAFPSGTLIPPYFQERCDWRFVEAILEAQMREKMKYQRQWIVKVTEGANSLAEVNRNIQRRMAKVGPDSYAGGMYLLLSEYFKLLLPELHRIQLVSRSLQLSPGLNLMDLRTYQDMQPLAIASSIEAAYHFDDVTVCLPEAWEFIPEERNTPVKMAATAFIKKAAGSGNFLWIDSQDLASVDKGVLKQVGVWILGVQGEINEVKHTLAQVALPPKQKPKPEEIQQLSVGQFYVCYGTVTKKVYVQPEWMESEVAIKIARGERPALSVNKPVDYTSELDRISARQTRPELNPYAARDARRIEELQIEEDINVDYKAAYEEAQRTILELKERIARLEHKIGLIDDTLSAPKSSAAQLKEAQVYAESLEPLAASLVGDEVAMSLTRNVPVIDVTVRKYVIEADDSTLRGRLAVLIAQGFFDSAQTGNSAFNELQRRGAGSAKPNVYREMDKLAELGFVTKEPSGGYLSVPGMKVNVKEVGAVA